MIDEPLKDTKENGSPDDVDIMLNEPDAGKESAATLTDPWSNPHSVRAG